MFKLFNKVREDKNEIVDVVKETTEQIDVVSEQVEDLNERYKESLTDDEIVQLHELLQRAKRDDRFKEKLANVDIWCISYESIMIDCKRIMEYRSKSSKAAGER